MSYPQTSPYYTTPTFNNEFLDVMVNRPIPLRADDTYWEITQTYNMRPDLLAYDLYGDSRLWWIFAARNPNILGPDPYFNMVAGLQIYIPTQNTLQRVLGI